MIMTRDHAAAWRDGTLYGASPRQTVHLLIYVEGSDQTEVVEGDNAE